MPSYTTITVRNTTGERPNDVHLNFNQTVEVLAVDELLPATAGPRIRWKVTGRTP